MAKPKFTPEQLQAAMEVLAATVTTPVTAAASAPAPTATAASGPLPAWIASAKAEAAQNVKVRKVSGKTSGPITYTVEPGSYQPMEADKKTPKGQPVPGLYVVKHVNGERVKWPIDGKFVMLGEAQAIAEFVRSRS